MRIMSDRELRRIREKVSCPELGDKHYGEWGILTRNQRVTICRLVEEVIRQREEIDRLYKCIHRLSCAVDLGAYGEFAKGTGGECE